MIPTFSAICSSVGRRSELGLELRHRALDLAGARPHGPGHPIQRAELVDDRALDAGDRVGLELHVAARVVALDRADQPEQSVGDEVALVDVRREAAPEPARDVLHERRVREDQPVAKGLISCLTELQPKCLCLVGPAHVGRIRCAPVFSSVSSANGLEEPTARVTRARQRAQPTRGRRPILWGCSRRSGSPRPPSRRRSQRAWRRGSRARAAARAQRSPRAWTGHAPGIFGMLRYNLRATQGRSSVGRAAVSKTVGRGFEPLRPCQGPPVERDRPTGGRPARTAAEQGADPEG